MFIELKVTQANNTALSFEQYTTITKTILESSLNPRLNYQNRFDKFKITGFKL